MLLGRMFAYADTHRYRIGPNYMQLPVNAPRGTTAHSYSVDGPMRYQHSGSAAVYAPNSYGGPAADPRAGDDAGWAISGEVARAAQALHAEDDDFGQARSMLTTVLDDAARERFVGNVAGHLRDGVSEPILRRAFAYWRAVDPGIGDRIEAAVRGH
jgi:catalase